MAPRCRPETALAPFTYTSTAGALGEACSTRTAPSASAVEGRASDPAIAIVTSVFLCIRSSWSGTAVAVTEPLRAGCADG